MNIQNVLAKNVIFSSGAMFVTVLLRDGVSSEYNYKTCQSVLLIQEIGNIYSIYKLSINIEYQISIESRFNKFRFKMQPIYM